MHGASRTSDWQANLDQLTDPFFNTDHVVVYPQAERYGDNGTYVYWEGSPNATADDIAYVSAILDDLESELCIDTARVYATGKSQGGGMVGRLACDEGTSARIAAFAPVSGAYYTRTNVSDADGCGDPATEAITCQPAREDIPLLAFHGGDDMTINIEGGFRNGGCLPDVKHWVAQWAARDGLDAKPAVQSFVVSSNGKKEDGPQLSEYGSGDSKGLVRFVYDGDNVDHDWPATIDNTDNEAHGSGPAAFNASSMIMEFFRNYTLATSTAEGSPTGTSPTSSSEAADSAASMISTNHFILGAIASIFLALSL